MKPVNWKHHNSLTILISELFSLSACSFCSTHFLLIRFFFWVFWKKWLPYPVYREHIFFRIHRSFIFFTLRLENILQHFFHSFNNLLLASNRFFLHHCLFLVIVTIRVLQLVMSQESLELPWLIKIAKKSETVQDSKHGAETFFKKVYI